MTCWLISVIKVGQNPVCQWVYWVGVSHYWCFIELYRWHFLSVGSDISDPCFPTVYPAGIFKYRITKFLRKCLFELTSGGIKQGRFSFRFSTPVKVREDPSQINFKCLSCPCCSGWFEYFTSDFRLFLIPDHLFVSVPRSYLQTWIIRSSCFMEDELTAWSWAHPPDRCGDM